MESQILGKYVNKGNSSAQDFALRYRSTHRELHRLLDRMCPRDLIRCHQKVIIIDGRDEAVQRTIGTARRKITDFFFAKSEDDDIIKNNAERDTGGLEHGKMLSHFNVTDPAVLVSSLSKMRASLSAS